MEKNLKGYPTISSELMTNIVPVQKSCYSSPVLRVFGAISKLTQGNNSFNTDARGGMRDQSGSDRLMKENTVHVDCHPLGIGLYLFDYKPEYRDRWGHGRQFGVMADEVDEIMPEAVTVHPDGYKIVNYAMLGISRSLH